MPIGYSHKVYRNPGRNASATLAPATLFRFAPSPSAALRILDSPFELKIYK